MPQEPHRGSVPEGEDHGYPDATAPTEPGEFDADRAGSSPHVEPPPLPPPLPFVGPQTPVPTQPLGAYGASPAPPWTPSADATQPQGPPPGYPPSQQGAPQYPLPYQQGAPQYPPPYQQGDPSPYQQGAPQYPPTYGVDPVMQAPPAPRKRSRRPLWIALSVLAALVILVGGLLFAMFGGQKAEARCNATGCTLTLTRAGSGVDLTTVGGVRKIRHEGIEGGRATFSVDGEERSCRRGEEVSAAGLTFTCSAVNDDTLTLQVSQ